MFKKWKATDPNNYRPISLTSVCCKNFESIIKDQLLSYLMVHSLISKEQHGFLQKHSTTTNLIESVNNWTMSLEKRIKSWLSICWFRKKLSTRYQSLNLCTKFNALAFLVYYWITWNPFWQIGSKLLKFRVHSPLIWKLQAGSHKEVYWDLSFSYFL